VRIRGSLLVDTVHYFLAQATALYTRKHWKSNISCQLTHQQYSELQFLWVFTLSYPWRMNGWKKQKLISRTLFYFQSIKTIAISQIKILKQQLEQCL